MKTLLKPHVSAKWKVVDKNRNDLFLEKFVAFLRKVLPDISKTNRRKSRGGKQKLKRLQPVGSEDNSNGITDVGKRPNGEAMFRKRIKQLFTVGMNETVRALQKDELAVMFVDEAALHPSAVALFVGMLADSTEKPAYALADLGKTVAPVLALRVVSAIGLRKSDEVNGLGDVLKEAAESLSQFRLEKRELLNEEQRSATDFVDPLAIVPVSGVKRSKK